MKRWHMLVAMLVLVLEANGQYQQAPTDSAIRIGDYVNTGRIRINTRFFILQDTSAAIRAALAQLQASLNDLGVYDMNDTLSVHRQNITYLFVNAIPFTGTGNHVVYYDGTRLRNLYVRWPLVQPDSTIGTDTTWGVGLVTPSFLSANGGKPVVAEYDMNPQGQVKYIKFRQTNGHKVTVVGDTAIVEIPTNAAMQLGSLNTSIVTSLGAVLDSIFAAAVGGRLYMRGHPFLRPVDTEDGFGPLNMNTASIYIVIPGDSTGTHRDTVRLRFNTKESDITGSPGMIDLDFTVTETGTHNMIEESELTTALSVKQNSLTMSKGGAWSFISAIGADSSLIIWRATQACTITGIYAQRTGGTSASINARKGSSDLLAANYATTTSMASAGTPQNTAVSAGDVLTIRLRAISGEATDIYVQVDYTVP